MPLPCGPQASSQPWWLPGLSICLLVGQPQNKCAAESDNVLRLHRLLDTASHCTNFCSDLLDRTSHCKSWCSDLLDRTSHCKRLPITCVTQVSYWIQQRIYSELDQFISKLIVGKRPRLNRKKIDGCQTRRQGPAEQFPMLYSALLKKTL